MPRHTPATLDLEANPNYPKRPKQCPTAPATALQKSNREFVQWLQTVSLPVLWLVLHRHARVAHGIPLPPSWAGYLSNATSRNMNDRPPANAAGSGAYISRCMAHSLHMQDKSGGTESKACTTCWLPHTHRSAGKPPRSGGSTSTAGTTCWLCIRTAPPQKPPRSGGSTQYSLHYVLASGGGSTWAAFLHYRTVMQHSLCFQKLHRYVSNHKKRNKVAL